VTSGPEELIDAVSDGGLAFVRFLDEKMRWLEARPTHAPV